MGTPTSIATGTVLSDVVDALVAVDPTTLDEITLSERILDLRVQRRRLEAAEADLLRVFDARGASVAEGYGSASSWLAARDGVTSFGEAKAQVGLGRDLALLPQMAAAFAEGAISATHVRQVAKALRPLDRALLAAGDAALAPVARTLDPRQFAHLIATWLREVRPDADDKREQRDWESRSFSLAQTYAGMWHGVLNAEPDGGARLRALLDVRAAKTGPEDTRTKDQRFYDALMSLVGEALANAATPRSGAGGNVPEIIVHARPENLLDDPDAPTPTTADGTPLRRSAWSRICCDARWTRLLVDPAGVPLDLGRTTRDWSPGQRKVIHALDGGCRYRDCPMPGTHIHHCQYWRNGGKTCIENGLLVCGYHHYCIHTLGYDVKLLPDRTAIWTLPNGTVLESQPRGPTARMLL